MRYPSKCETSFLNNRVKRIENLLIARLRFQRDLPFFNRNTSPPTHPHSSEWAILPHTLAPFNTANFIQQWFHNSFPGHAQWVLTGWTFRFYNFKHRNNLPSYSNHRSAPLQKIRIDRHIQCNAHRFLFPRANSHDRRIFWWWKLNFHGRVFFTQRRKGRKDFFRELCAWCEIYLFNNCRRLLLAQPSLTLPCTIENQLSGLLSLSAQKYPFADKLKFITGNSRCEKVPLF